MNDYKTLFMYGLGAMVVVCSIVLIVMLYFFTIPSANRDAAMIAIGTGIGWGSSVVSYFFHSSKGSADKAEFLQKNEKNNI